MESRNRTRLIGGLLLILLGGWLLAIRLVPSLEWWMEVFTDWPVTVIGVGILLLVFGLLVNAPGMAVPACIVGGIGGILLYQNRTGDWASWSYIWALIPGFVGVGVMLSGLLEGRFRNEVSGGLWLIFISAILFGIFGAFLGGLTILGNYWPVLLILLGLWIIVKAALRRSV